MIVMRLPKRDSLIPLTLLAAASGGRATAGVAAMSRRGCAAQLLATGELVADKMPGIPDRIDTAPMLARVAAGAVVGAMVGEQMGLHRGGAAALGGLIAFVATHATYRMRRSLSRRVGRVEAALIEDALVAGMAVAGARRLRSNQRLMRVTPRYLRG